MGACWLRGVRILLYGGIWKLSCAVSARMRSFTLAPLCIVVPCTRWTMVFSTRKIFCASNLIGSRSARHSVGSGSIAAFACLGFESAVRQGLWRAATSGSVSPVVMECFFLGRRRSGSSGKAQKTRLAYTHGFKRHLGAVSCYPLFFV